ncbi:MAG: FkbM family methyltransferase [Spirochaetales bacterium]
MTLKDIIKEYENGNFETYQNLIEKLKKFERVYLYGISESAVVAVKVLSKNKIKINGILEADSKKIGSMFNELPVLSYNQIADDSKTAIVITCSYCEQIKKAIIANDKSASKRIFVFDGYFLDKYKSGLYDENKDKIYECYNSLNDAHSKKLYLALLKYRYTRKISLIENLFEPRTKTYYDSVFLNNFKDGLYVDAGSYNADFIEGLSNLKDVSKCNFYIFEPNKMFAENINANLNKNINYKVFQTALCDKKAKLDFEQIASSTSHLIKKRYNAYKNTLQSKVETVEADTLDNIIGQNIVSGIKIDIEGAEQAMLKGSINTIKRDRPTMLISIYHKWNDLWKIQSFIQEMDLNYSFYIRHYSLSVAKTILYCIPN